MADDVFLSERSWQSGRFAIVEDAGDSVWLYLTHRDSQAPELDCWLFNTPSAPRDPELQSYRARSIPPPAPSSSIAPAGVFNPPDPELCRFRWALAGDAVLFVINNVPVGLISAPERRAASRHLLHAGPWGTPWDDDVVRSIFGV